MILSKKGFSGEIYHNTTGRIELAGANGATDVRLQLRHHQLGRAGRWRRSRHLKRVQRPRQDGTENDRVGLSIPGKSPLFERSFHEIEFYSESVLPRSRRPHYQCQL